jgi:hypothetical protein
MRAFFEEANGNNLVIITDGVTAKIYDCTPDGIFEGIDLYTETTVEDLKKHFAKLAETGELADFEDMHSDNEMSFDEIEEELEESVLIFEGQI